MLDWIGQLAKEDGLTMILTTHHPHHALALADRALLMLEPARYLIGPIRDVLIEDNLRALYDMKMKRVSVEVDGQMIDTLMPVFVPSARGERTRRRR